MNDIQTIQNKIYDIRGQRVILDFDLAAMYGVETRALNQAVKRNIERFPEDFMLNEHRHYACFLAIRHMAATLPQPDATADVAQLRKDFENLNLDIEDILHDQNDINESTRAQLDAISTALSELQVKEPRNALVAP